MLVGVPGYGKSMPLSIRDIDPGQQDTHVPSTLLAKVEADLQTSVVDGCCKEVTTNCG